ncbi:MAG TPA: amidohydrolase family protein [Terracidiphilus sp.]
MQVQRIDAHHHLWRYVPEEYPWMESGMQALHRDYLLEDLAQVTQAAGVTGTVAVQARQSTVETEWLSGLAAGSDLIRGVVGWAPLIDADVREYLERISSMPKVKAVRHVLHDEPDDLYMLREDFNRGVSHLKDLGLRYDLLIREGHLRQTIEFVDRHPGQIFILDHVAKPLIKERTFSPWRENMRELARRGNVYCKLSGMTTEADWSSWRDGDLMPYFDIALETFGPARSMFGSDWPVLNLACSYERWMMFVERAVIGLSPHERGQVLSSTAVEAYGL